MKVFQLFFLFVLPVLCQEGTTPFITGSSFGFTNARSQVKTQGISIDPVMGSKVVNGYIQFPIAKGILSYEYGRINDGQIAFDGGARFSEQAAPDATFTFTNFVVNLSTRQVTATLDSNTDMPFGTVNLTTLAIHKVAGESAVSLSPIDLQMLLDSNMLATINAKFTTKLQVENHTVPITLTLVVDLLSEGNVDINLIDALQLYPYVDIGGAEGLRASSFDVEYSFLK